MHDDANTTYHQNGFGPYTVEMMSSVIILSGTDTEQIIIDGEGQ
jgi:hypothetical protein